MLKITDNISNFCNVIDIIIQFLSALTQRTLLRAATLWASWASISGSVSALCRVCWSFCLASSRRSCSCLFFSSLWTHKRKHTCIRASASTRRHQIQDTSVSHNKSRQFVIGDIPYLSVQGLLAGQLIFQLVFDIMERSRLPLGTEVPACNTKPPSNVRFIYKH